MSRSALPRGNACTDAACARIEALGSGAMEIRTGGRLFNAGIITGAASINIDAAVMTNANLINAAAGFGTPTATPALSVLVGGQFTNTGTLRGSGSGPASGALNAVSIAVGGAVVQEGTGRIEALAGTLSAADDGGLSLTTIGGFTNAGAVTAAGGLVVTTGGAILNSGSLLTPTRLRLASSAVVVLGGSLTSGQLEVTGASIRLDGALLTLSQSAWFAAADITAGATTRVVHPSARPTLVFDTSSGGTPGTVLADRAGEDDAAQATQLASFLALGTGPGGLVTLDLEAEGAAVFLLLGDGTARGQLMAGRLGVQGASGAAVLTGTIAEQDGPGSAQRATLSPQADAQVQARYMLNGCIIALPACGATLPTGTDENDDAMAILARPGGLGGVVPVGELLAEQEQFARPAIPSILLTSALNEATLRSTPPSVQPQPRQVALRAARARLADPDLVLPLSLAEEE